MARTYHTRFGVSHLDRVELFRRINKITGIHGMRFCGDCIRLRTNLDKLVFAYEERKQLDPTEAVAATLEWDGIMLEYETLLGDRSILLYRDRRIDGEVCAIEDSTGHFLRIIETPSNWVEFRALVIDFMEAVGSEFGVTLCDGTREAWNVKDLGRYLLALSCDSTKARPPLVILSNKIVNSDLWVEQITRWYQVSREGGLNICEEVLRGLGPD